MQNVAQAYFKTQVSTTDQGEILVMLYTSAIGFLEQAKEKIAERDMATKGMLISRAMDIINELDNSLDTSISAEFTASMHQLYIICNTRLLQANLKLDISQIDSVIGILSSISSAYAQVINTPEARKAAEQIASKNSQKTTGFIQKTNSFNSAHANTNVSQSFANQAYAKSNNQNKNTADKISEAKVALEEKQIEKNLVLENNQVYAKAVLETKQVETIVSVKSEEVKVASVELISPEITAMPNTTQFKLNSNRASNLYQRSAL